MAGATQRALDIDRLLYDELSRRKTAPEERTDIMAMLLAARDEDGRSMSDNAWPVIPDWKPL